jgi:hypothetical protein
LQYEVEKLAPILEPIIGPATQFFKEFHNQIGAWLIECLKRNKIILSSYHVWVHPEQPNVIGTNTFVEGDTRNEQEFILILSVLALMARLEEIRQGVRHFSRQDGGTN